MNQSNRTISSFIWKFLERGGYLGVQFLVQLVLARLVAPAQFGIVSIMASFINLVQVFTQNGLNMALVQNQEVTEDDYSTVFYVNFGVMTIFYIIFYTMAPYIERFYKYDNFVSPFRVLALVFFAMAISSVQLAKLTKELRFKAILKCSLFAAVLSGVVGIIMAYKGFGLWALVVHTLLNQVLNTIALVFMVSWRPRLVFSMARVKVLFSFGGKLLAGSMISSLNDNFRSFIIGKYASASDLAFYKRGKLFPQTAANVVSSTTQSVMLPLLAERQNDEQKMLKMLRRTASMSAYLVTPALTGLLIVSEPLIKLLLTDKWLPAVPYMQIACISFIFYQMHYIYTQALNAKGESGITLVINIIIISSSFISCLLAMMVFHSVIMVSWGTLIVIMVVGLPLDAYYASNKLHYGFAMQLQDIIQPIIMSVIMLLASLSVRFISDSALTTLIIQILLGVGIYIGLSVVLQNDSFKYIFRILRNIFLKRKT